VKLESTKKIAKADVIVGVQGDPPPGGPLAIVKTMDPNKTHPLRQNDVMQKIGVLHGRPLTSHLFQAIVWRDHLKEDPRMCRRATEGILTRYSHDAVSRIKQLSVADVDAALIDYRAYCRSRSHAAKKP
jgi:hypothetical protein